MRRETGLYPNEVTVISLLPVFADKQALGEGKCVHVYAVKLGFLCEAKVVNSLISMYGRCCAVYAACQLFEAMSFKNLVSWNSVIAVHVQNGLSEEGIYRFNNMRIAGIEPDRATIVTLLQAFGDLAAIRPGRAIHGYIIGSGFNLDVPVGTALISVYSKCGSLDASYKLFIEMNNPDRITWTSMLASYSMHGHGREAIDCFNLMVKKGIRPDHVTFTHVLNACSHSGLIDEGKMYFESMPKDYGVTPQIDHYSCMVDLLGRSGLLDEARELIESMPMEPNAGVWGALIAACRVQRNIKFGKEVAERLIALEPSDPRNYIILSNMYSAAGQWKEASEVRALMRARGLRKVPGYSYIEHGGKVHCFVVGDESHPESKQIYVKLGELIVKIVNAGYVPNTEFVLHDVDEEVKKDMIYKHSEKLAIAFGILVNGTAIPIMITKNLRICGDCHSAAKFISLVEKCAIVVRDSKRFHHFANGLCSCGDYW
ncbi:Pentatricopeptide repeat-containing protein [Thalictrum thalictroides]|uniref:Pentatricopeptide repeat-containing protein n=1 Tax=Thalictrum thalictroides TaxID=46969 RepID=A0A7J6W8V7_THATH|nr:Pentatricopeptide repeat-containing protein [Thalictrum thalictroides]